MASVSSEWNGLFLDFTTSGVVRAKILTYIEKGRRGGGEGGGQKSTSTPRPRLVGKVSHTWVELGRVAAVINEDGVECI